jgi:hypothetical protein
LSKSDRFKRRYDYDDKKKIDKRTKFSIYILAEFKQELQLSLDLDLHDIEIEKMMLYAMAGN